MRLISHRGNQNGKDENLENNPTYVLEAIAAGYNVEVDVWSYNHLWFLGHDNPQYSISGEFLLDPNIWCHAKNIEAMREMLRIGAHCFWHENDKITLTSQGYIWTFPGEPLTDLSICVLPKITSTKISQCAGVCSDEIAKYNKTYNSNI
tara:strand:- start:142 stop:588 length:447 start_codon:yes stop_codon:yes gene_type:complete